ncbi:MAG: hypothetical protein KDC46_06135 [Thermoleophilia bacterium]|nr:hypothetical protein [Thermoleophilia bacterium]
MESSDDQTTEGAPSNDGSPEVHPSASLRGSFFFVLVMAAFFAAAWFGVLAIALERR